jgi:N-acyl-D-amino-acid deacylase
MMGMNSPILISGGTIVDGRGGEPFVGDVLVRDGRIAEIGVVAKPEQVTEIDARGLMVTPGFIDIHSHSDFTLFNDPRSVSQITQGVTLEVVGNCGHGCAPITTPELFHRNIYGYEPGMDMPWRTVGQYLDALEAGKPAVNVITLVPNGNLRIAVVGDAERPATTRERKQMRSLLKQGMEEGAWGYSTGLEYGPEVGCSEEEVTELCGVAAKAGGLRHAHAQSGRRGARDD